MDHVHDREDHSNHNSNQRATHIETKTIYQHCHASRLNLSVLYLHNEQIYQDVHEQAHHLLYK